MNKDDEFTIDDVAGLLGLTVLRRSGAETFCVCPFCGDKRGKFSYTLEKGGRKNVYSCFHCGEGGSALTLWKKLSGNTYSGADENREAARDIHRALEGNAGMVEERRRAIPVQKSDEAERASDEQCSKAYYSLLDRLTLNDRHKEDLVRRGLTEEGIRRFRFRSVPTRDAWKVTASLVHDGISLEGVPGFYKDGKGRWQLSLPSHKDGDGHWHTDGGYLCPVFDGERNLILGFQIRMDEPKHGCKYLWLSSAGKKDGATSGAITTRLPGKDAGAVIITEGVLKATVIYSLLKGEVTVMGVPGVSSINGLDRYLPEMKGAYVFEAYDMDKRMRTDDPHEKEKTERIAKAEDKLIRKLESFGIGCHTLTWDTGEDGLWDGNYKGLDDFLLSYGGKSKFISYIKGMAERERTRASFLEACSKIEA